MKFTLKKELKFKSGMRIEKGEIIHLNMIDKRLSLSYNDLTLKNVSFEILKYVNEIIMPNERELLRMFANDHCETPLGEVVEPDGYGPSGWPSWLLIFGLA